MKNRKPRSGLTLKPEIFNSSLEKGLQILEAFDFGIDLGVTQLAEATGLEKSAVQRFINTLVHLGYLQRDPATRRYNLTPRILHLGSRYLRGNPLAEKARPYLLECNIRTGQTVNLGVRHDHEIILMIRYAGSHMVRPEIVVGSSFVWHASALGQAIVAHLPAPESREMVEAATFVQYAKNTIMKKQDLARRLDEVRKQGFALSISEAYDGDITVAAPVYDHADRPYAAVSIAVLTSEKTPAYVRKHLAPVVVELARAVSATAGMQRPASR